MQKAFKIPESVVARQVGEEVVILNLDTGTYFGLDPVGARIWELIGEGETPAQICEVLQAEYDASPERVERDIERLVAALSDEKLIETSG